MGCGPGTDTIPLAHYVGVSGQIVGVDYDAEMIAEADQRALKAGVSAWVTHKRADAIALPIILSMDVDQGFVEMPEVHSGATSFR